MKVRRELERMRDAKYWIDKLRLEPHPEGGYFRQTYKADLILPGSALPGFAGDHSASTAIYFLLESDNFSALHRLKADEVWHFYAGSAIEVHVIDEGGVHSEILLGSDAAAEEVFQAVVKAGCWFGSRVRDGKSWALVGCTVAPGFEFADFEMGRREELVKLYPQHCEMIHRLTRG